MLGWVRLGAWEEGADCCSDAPLSARCGRGGALIACLWANIGRVTHSPHRDGTSTAAWSVAHSRRGPWRTSPLRSSRAEPRASHAELRASRAERRTTSQSRRSATAAESSRGGDTVRCPLDLSPLVGCSGRCKGCGPPVVAVRLCKLACTPLRTAVCPAHRPPAGISNNRIEGMARVVGISVCQIEVEGGAILPAMGWLRLRAGC